MSPPVFPGRGPTRTELDDIFLYWRHASGGEVARHAVIRNYAAVRNYLPRLLRRLNADLPTETLGRELLNLRERGSVVNLLLGPHRLGFGRPHILVDAERIDGADPPFLFCREPEDAPTSPCFPVLAHSREHAIWFARRVEARSGLPMDCWREYRCERLPPEHPSGGYLTELEARLAAAVRLGGNP